MPPAVAGNCFFACLFTPRMQPPFPGHARLIPEPGGSTFLWKGFFFFTLTFPGSYSSAVNGYNPKESS